MGERAEWLEYQLKEHEKWLNGEGGERIKLDGVVLNGADLSKENLSNASMKGIHCKGVNFSESNLSHVNIAVSELYWTNFSKVKAENAIFNVAARKLGNLLPR